MSQSYRLDKIGLINRGKKISFKFNGKKYFGYEGDTLASALIANGIHLIGRSFKYHRPRGFFGAGVDEPYAIVLNVFLLGFFLSKQKYPTLNLKFLYLVLVL